MAHLGFGSISDNMKLNSDYPARCLIIQKLFFLKNKFFHQERWKSFTIAAVNEPYLDF